MEQFLENIKDLEVTTVARAQEALDNKETATFFFYIFYNPANSLISCADIEESQRTLICPSAT